MATDELGVLDVLDMDFGELMSRVAEVAATGDRRAHHELKLLADEERRARCAREEGREPEDDTIARLSASAVLTTSYPPRPSRREGTDDV